MNARTFLVALILAAPMAHAGGAPTPPAATKLSVVRSEAAEPFKLVRVDGSPARYVAEWTTQMPTPGWTFELDSFTIEGDRIVAELTAIRPDGIMSQVIAPGTAKIPLGSLTRGTYFFEIRSRRGRNIEPMAAFAAVLNAH